MAQESKGRQSEGTKWPKRFRADSLKGQNGPRGLGQTAWMDKMAQESKGRQPEGTKWPKSQTA